MTEAASARLKRRIELFGVAGADRIGDFVEHQSGVVGAEHQHVLAGQHLGLGRVKAQLFEFATRDFAIVAQAVAQGRGDVRIGRNAGLREGFIDQPQNGLVGVGVTGQGTTGLGAFDQRPQRIARREIAGLEHDDRASRVGCQLAERYRQRLAGIADANDAALAEQATPS